jgi:transcriptional regulator with XRE-family HTH domain
MSPDEELHITMESEFTFRGPVEIDSASSLTLPHMTLARRLRDSRRSRRPKMHQVEAAAVLGLSQSAFSRLENGETKRWSKKARNGAALIIGVSRDRIDAILAGDSPEGDRLGRLAERLDNLAATIEDTRTMLAEVLHSSSGGAAEFGVLIRSVRLARGLSLIEASVEIGLAFHTLRRIEEGAAALKPYARKLSDFLGVDNEQIHMLFDAMSDDQHTEQLAAIRSSLFDRLDDAPVIDAALEGLEAAIHHAVTPVDSHEGVDQR